MRRRKHPHIKQEQPDDSNSSAGKRTPTPASQPEEWRLEAAIVSLLNLADEDNRLISPPFRVLPKPEEYPLYYKHITNPIDLKTIAENIREGKYATWQDIDADVQLMCKNAKIFNEPGSMVFKDSTRLLQHFQSKIVELAEARRFSPRMISKNKELIDELLRSTASEIDEYSEDSEEDEDSEKSEDPKWQLYWSIRNYDVIDGIPLCENFMELPSKRQYPDYYDEIEKPISLYMINNKLKRGQYEDLASLVNDLLLMFDNACSYNIDGSEIFMAATRLRQCTLETAKSLDPNFRIAKGAKASKNGTQNLKEESNDIEENNDEDTKSTADLPMENGIADKNGASTSSEAVAEALPRKSPTKRRRLNPDGTPLERQKPGRKSFDELRDKYAKVLLDVLQDINDIKLGDRVLSEPFLYLPCDKTFPDYYKTIVNPISLTCIRNKILHSKYHESDEMLRDIKVMCENARKYNRPGSQICADSSILESVAIGSMQSRTGGKSLMYPLRRKEKGLALADDRSSTETPQKLKKRQEIPDMQIGDKSAQLNGHLPMNFSNHQSTSSSSMHHHQQQPHLPNGLLHKAIMQGPTTSNYAGTHATTSYANDLHGQQYGQLVNQKHVPHLAHGGHQQSASTVYHRQIALHQAMASSAQLQYDPGRTIVPAPPRPPEPTFMPPSTSVYVKRVVHSETYIRYLESLHNNDSSDKSNQVSRWDKSLQATQKNTVIPPHRRPPYEWIKQIANGSKSKEDEIVRALWKLRNQLVEGTNGILMEKGAEAEATAPRPSGFEDGPSSSGTGGKPN